MPFERAESKRLTRLRHTLAKLDKAKKGPGAASKARPDRSHIRANIIPGSTFYAKWWGWRVYHYHQVAGLSLYYIQGASDILGPEHAFETLGELRAHFYRLLMQNKVHFKSFTEHEL